VRAVPDQAILTCRLIDRPLRPSFPEGFRNEVHIVGTVLGADQVNPHDVLAINAASAALMISDIPFEGPIGAVRLAYDADGEWIPTPPTRRARRPPSRWSSPDASSPDGDVAVMMVEAGGTENAWDLYEDGAPKVDEAALAAGLEAAKQWIKEAIALQNAAGRGIRRQEAGPWSSRCRSTTPTSIYAAVRRSPAQRIAEIMRSPTRPSAPPPRGAPARRGRRRAHGRAAVRRRRRRLAVKQVKAAFKARSPRPPSAAASSNEGARIDGRGTRDLRPLSAEVGVLPTAHGTGLFQRGETQVLNVATLGMGEDGPDDRRHHAGHRSATCTTTTSRRSRRARPGFMRGPKRREIGHGLLAERALLPVVPAAGGVPLRDPLVSDVLASNGSTSMASVCGSTLSLMDAGVPIKAPVAGIAMGLIYADGKYTRSPTSSAPRTPSATWTSRSPARPSS
jgi:polyribonucleotide nucleotidyltransferase